MSPSGISSEMHGVRVLVVEDALLVADLIVDSLVDQGCEVVGPVARLEQGLELARREELDGALLDVNLAGKRCFPIADLLSQRGIPFAFLTGYGDEGIPPEYRAMPRLTKPFDQKALAGLVSRCFKHD